MLQEHVIKVCLIHQGMYDNLPVMDVPERYEVLDPEALGVRLGYTRSTVLTHLSRGRWDKIPQPSKRLAMGPVWYVGDVEKWREGSLTPTDPNAGTER